jgi:hypothetical protein
MAFLVTRIHQCRQAEMQLEMSHPPHKGETRFWGSQRLDSTGHSSLAGHRAEHYGHQSSGR